MEFNKNTNNFDTIHYLAISFRQTSKTNAKRVHKYKKNGIQKNNKKNGLIPDHYLEQIYFQTIKSY